MPINGGSCPAEFRLHLFCLRDDLGSKSDSSGSKMDISGAWVDKSAKTADRLLGRYDSTLCRENAWQTYAKFRKNWPLHLQMAQPESRMANLVPLSSATIGALRQTTDKKIAGGGFTSRTCCFVVCTQSGDLPLRTSSS